MDRQITTYTTDYLSYNYDIYIVSPSSPAVFAMPLPDNISVNIVIPDKSDKTLEFPYLIYESHFFSFKKSIQCKLSFKKNHFQLNNDLLEISVWGSNEEEAIDAFNFQFYSLYINFALENDNNLSDEAIKLKSKILDLISLVL
jgi:hypothetical protein